ncbi:hypothetical protein H4582DRAFT_1351825 [Lactarius indigo]|nr:hypothetical protein H4582DRAFT_1351825 [Lactarius indigo]
MASHPAVDLNTPLPSHRYRHTHSPSRFLFVPSSYRIKWASTTTATRTCLASGPLATHRQATRPHIPCHLCPSTPRLRRIAHTTYHLIGNTTGWQNPYGSRNGHQLEWQPPPVSSNGKPTMANGLRAPVDRLHPEPSFFWCVGVSSLLSNAIKRLFYHVLLHTRLPTSLVAHLHRPDPSLPHLGSDVRASNTDA